MLKTYRIAAISLFSFISASVVASPLVLAQFRPFPNLPKPQRLETTISGKVYLPDNQPTLLSSANCSNIEVGLEKEREVKNPSTGSDGGFSPRYMYTRIASTKASGDIKRGYCDYALTVIALSGKYFLSAGAQAGSIWNLSPGYRVESQSMGSWNNPFSDFNGSRDMKLYIRRPIG